MSKVLGPGRCRIPRKPFLRREKRHPVVELRFVDVRERAFTFKGQEILTSRNQLSEDLLGEVTAAATGDGVTPSVPTVADPTERVAPG